MVDERLVVGATLAIGLILFIAGRPPAAAVALLMTVILLLTGILEPAEATSGLGHPATVIVVCMFILSAAVRRTGLVHLALQRLLRVSRKSPGRFRTLLLTGATAVSGAIQNTPLVAMLLPVVTEGARVLRVPPGRFLIPLSYACMLGGLITLIGTRANIVASEILRASDLEPFGMFEWSWLGLILAGMGLVYLTTIGPRLLPDRGTALPADPAHLKEWLCEVTIQPNSPLIGQTVAASDLKRKFDIDVIRILRETVAIDQPLAHIRLRGGDVLVLRASRHEIVQIRAEEGIALQAELEHAPVGNNQVLVELMVSPGSSLIGKSLVSSRFLQTFGGLALAIRKRETLFLRRLGHVLLDPGDVLLVMIPQDRLGEIRFGKDLVVVQEIPREAYRLQRVPHVLAVLGLVILLPAFGLMDLVVTALAGVVAIVALGALRFEEVQEAIRWDVVFLLAGVLPVGLAMESTGLTTDLAAGLTRILEGTSPIWILAAIYLVTAVLNALISNAACAALMAPVAIAVALQTDFDPRVLVAAVMFASSADFLTPIGYETNMMVYSIGGYRFSDFPRVGLPLLILTIVVVALALAPRMTVGA